MARRRWHFFMTPLEHVSIRALDDRYRSWLTPMGRMVLWAGLAAVILTLGGLRPGLLATLGTLAWLGVAGTVLGFFFRPRVALRRQFGAFPTAGEVWSYRVRVENTGKTAVRNVLVEERGLPPELRPVDEPPLLDLLEPGAVGYVTLKLHCQRRGAYELPALQAASAAPSGLIKVPRVIKQRDQVLVYPAFSPLSGLDVPTGRNYQPGGMSIASNVGESPEVVGLREWREGDRPRDIHWPSMARTGKLLVKERMEEYFVRLALVLDVEARRVRDEVHMERALSVGAALAEALARKDYIIDLFCAGSAVHHFQAGRALAHMENILEILAALDGGDRLDLDGLTQALLPEAPRLSGVIFVMVDWEPGRLALVTALRGLGVAVRVVCVKPGKALTGLLPGEEVVLT